MKKEPTLKSIALKIVKYLAVTLVLLIVLGVLIGPDEGGARPHIAEGAAMQAAHAIERSLEEYAKDHDGHYPEGKTSTEVFQHLIDEKYVTAYSVFYWEWPAPPGKIFPSSDRLKSENVCWDVTCCVDSSAPGTLPVVFSTGFKINYQAGGAAEFLGPVPKVRTWREWVFGPMFGPSMPPERKPFKPYIAVCYKNESTIVKEIDEQGSIPNFIPADFDPKGKTYKQLTP